MFRVGTMIKFELVKLDPCAVANLLDNFGGENFGCKVSNSFHAGCL